MPLLNPKQYKSKDTYIQKCMEIEVGEYNKDEAQAYAICSSTWVNRYQSQSTTQVVNSKIRRLKK